MTRTCISCCLFSQLLKLHRSLSELPDFILLLLIIIKSLLVHFSWTRVYWFHFYPQIQYGYSFLFIFVLLLLPGMLSFWPSTFHTHFFHKAFLAHRDLVSPPAAFPISRTHLVCIHVCLEYNPQTHAPKLGWRPFLLLYPWQTSIGTSIPPNKKEAQERHL